MTKVGTGAKFEDSNISALNSKEHKDAKLNAAKTEKAWNDAGKKVGVQCWRIEKFKVVPQPAENLGKFYSGDSYIVLNTYKSPENQEKLLYNVHFWLGKDTTQDEAGTAAYKTVELDDLLGDLPVQYREVQGHESKEFLDLFKGRITTMEGGVDSGFNKVEPAKYTPRLLQLKGKKDIRVTEVKKAVGSLNDGDSFLLDAGLKLYIWNGKSSGMFEKRKANEVGQALKTERNGKPTLDTLDGVEKNVEFWTFLGQAGGAPPAASEIGAPTPDDKVPENKSILFELSDKTGKLVMTKVKDKNPSKGDLKSEEVFLLDTGPTVYVWIGLKASKEERSNGIKFGQQYLKDNGIPEYTPVVRIMEKNEPKAFWLSFK